MDDPAGDFLDSIFTPEKAAAPTAQPDADPAAGFLDSIFEPQWYEARKKAEAPETTKEYLATHVAPVVKTIKSIWDPNHYKNVMERINAGDAEQKDYDFAAKFEKAQERESQKGVGQTVLDTAASLPGTALEFAATGGVLKAIGPVARGLGMAGKASEAATKAGRLGQFAGRTGAMTAMNPQFYAPGAIQNATETGGDWYDRKNLGPAFAQGAVTVGILGQLAGMSKSQNIIVDAVKKGAIGVGEQQAADAVNYALGVQTNYGAVQDFLEGKSGEGWKRLAAEMTMFAGFAGQHRIAEKFFGAIAGMKKSGMSDAAIEKKLAEVHEGKEVEGPKALTDYAKEVKAVEELADLPKPEFIPADEAGQRQDQPLPNRGSSERVEFTTNRTNHDAIMELAQKRLDANPNAIVIVDGKQLKPRQEPRIVKAVVESPVEAVPESRPATPVEVPPVVPDAKAGQPEAPAVVAEAPKPVDTPLTPLQQRQDAVLKDRQAGLSLRKLAEKYDVSYEQIRKDERAARERAGVEKSVAVQKKEEAQAVLRDEAPMNRLQGETAIGEMGGARDRDPAALSVDENAEMMSLLGKPIKDALDANDAQAFLKAVDEAGYSRENFDFTEWKETYENVRKAEAKVDAAKRAEKARGTGESRIAEVEARSRGARKRQEPVPEPSEAASSTAKVAGKLTDREMEEAALADMNRIPDQPGKPGMGAARANFGDPQAATPEAAPGAGSKVASYIRGQMQSLSNHWRSLSGEAYPATAKLSEEASNKMMRYAAAPIHAEKAAPYYIDRVMNGITDGSVPSEKLTLRDREAIGRKFMTAFYEMRLRHMREQFLKQADDLQSKAANSRKLDEPVTLMAESKKYRQMAEDVKTMIGRENSELGSEESYQKTIANPHFKAFLDRWKEHVVPVIDDFYRRAEGIDPHFDLESMTQIPGLPFNMKPVREGDPQGDTVVMFGSSAGNLKNPKLHKLGFAKQATGAAAGYDIDPAQVIAHSIAESASLAAKADAVRQLVKDGLGIFAIRSSKHDFDGRKAVEIPDVSPPKGTQDAGAMDKSLFVHPDVAAEFKKMLDVNDPVSSWMGAPLLTKVAVASLVEPTVHGMNLMSSTFKPGVSPVDMAKNAWGVITKNPDIQKRIVDLAEMGAMKHSHPEGGVLWGGKSDPTVWTGKFLDTLDKIVRLTAGDAFQRLKRQGRAVGSEANERNFINQSGLYIRRAQHKLVQFARDSGLGPFATAGTNFTIQGLKSVVGRSGVKAPTATAQFGLHAEYLARMAVAVAVVPMLVNWFKWGRVDGDDNTPLGAIKLGVDDRGKTAYLDTASWTPFVRGARTMGLQALMEGMRYGAKPNDIANRARKDAVAGLTHPFEGPAVNFVHGALTGENTYGMDISPKGKSGDIDLLLDMQGAVMNANPTLATITGSDRPNAKDRPLYEKVSGLFGRLGPKWSSWPRGKPFHGKK